MTVVSEIKQTLANLKGIESTLRIYSLQSKNKDEANAYREALKTTESVTKNIEDRLITIKVEEPQYNKR